MYIRCNSTTELCTEVPWSNGEQPISVLRLEQTCVLHLAQHSRGRTADPQHVANSFCHFPLFTILVPYEADDQKCLYKE